MALRIKSNNARISGTSASMPTINRRPVRCSLRYNLPAHIILLIVVMALNSAVALAEDPSRTLDFADFQATSDGGVEIRLALSEPAPTPADFTSKSPAKISLDLPKTKNNLPWSLPLPIETGAAKTLKATQTKNRTRVVIALNELVAYKIRTEGTNIFVTLSASGASATPVAAASPAQSAPAEVETTPTPPPPRAVKTAASSAPKPTGTRGRGNSLQDIRFNALPGERVQFTLSFSRPATEPGSFTIDNPARIALDFPNTANNLGWKNKNVGIGFAKSVTTVEAGNRTRVILNLVSLLPFDTQVSGRNIIVTLDRGRAASKQGPSAGGSNISTAVPGDDTRHQITNLDFRRGPKGEGRVVVSLSDANTPVSSGESGNQIFVDFGNTGLPNDLQQRLDVVDFATPVQFIDTTRVGNRVRLAITPAGAYEYLAYHSGATYTIEVKKASVSDKEKKKEDETGGYTGEKLSLNFQDIEVRAVLQLIADFTGLNMVTSDSVQGNLTLRLKNVPWDQALDIILKTKGLAMRRSGNVILVAPSEEISAREKLELEAKKQLEELEPLRSEIIQVNYAKAKQVEALLKADATAVLSERGSTSVDERTNTLIIIDTADRLIEARKLIGKLDIPVRQVMIESRIVIADDSFAKDLGARFGITGVGNDDTLTVTSGSLSSNDDIIDQAIDNGGPPITPPVEPGTLSDRLNINLPALPSAGSAARIAFSVLDSNTLLDLELSALESDGRGEVISNPRVVTANQQEAIIKQGTQVPYQEASSSGATSVSFKDAVLALKVTPQITPDDRIMLDLAVNKDSVGAIFNGVPSINTKEVKTQVLIDNGATVVLGGVYEQEKVDSLQKVPFLGDIPFLGVLFRSTQLKNNKNELLIFVTPKILKQSLSAVEEQ